MEDRPGFLPPEPAGPEPELGSPPPPPEPPTQPLPPQQPQAPPPQQQPYPYPPPQQGWQPPPPPGQGWQQQSPAPPGWAYQPQPAQPDNGSAIAGFVLSLVSGSLLFISFGVSSIVSVGCAIAGIIYSRKGKQKVESGQTTKHAGLAQAGFVISIVSLVLSVLATLVWILVIVAAITDEQFRDDLEREFDNSDSIRAGLQLATAGVRLLAG